METRARFLSALTIGVCLASATAAAKPRVGVQTVFEPSAALLRDTIARELKKQPDRPTPEAAITSEFITVFGELGVFDFVPATDAPVEITIHVTGAWPGRPGKLVLKTNLTTVALPPIEIAPAHFASDTNPLPSSKDVADMERYRARFAEALGHWPAEILNPIPVCTAAEYRAGKIIVPLPLGELGQIPGGPPRVFFAAQFGDVQRQFVLCEDQQGKAIGHDHGDHPAPNCATKSQRAQLQTWLGGKVTLLGAFPR